MRFLQHHSRHSRLGLMTIIGLMMHIGCAGPASKNPPAAHSLVDIDDTRSPHDQLKQLVADEAAGRMQRRAPGSHSLPYPPGVEPDVLARRDPLDDNVFATLDEVLAQLSTQPLRSPNTSDDLQRPVDSEAQTQALKLYARGRNAALDNRHLQAVLDFQKALELDPASPQLLRELARSYLADNRTAQAVVAYERLIGVEPDNPEALFTIGLAAANRREFGRAAGALARLRIGGKLSQVDATYGILTDFSLAFALRELGYDRASIAAATAALTPLPDRFSAIDVPTGRLGSVYRQRGETWRAIGDAHCRLGEFDHALAAYNIAAGLPTADPSALHARIIYANLHLARPFAAQHQLLTSMQLQERTIDDREVRLCAYLKEHAQPVDLLARAVSDLYRSHPETSGLVRAAASLLEVNEARKLLNEYINRQPRDLHGVHQLLTWLGEADAAAAADLAVSLSTDHPDLAHAYADRLMIALPSPAAALTAVESLKPSAGRFQVHTRLLQKSGGLGQAWTICLEGRSQWLDDRALMLTELQLAAAMGEAALFDRSLSKLPSHFFDAAGLIGVSQAQRVLGRFPAALQLAQQAVDADPQNVEALIELARAQGALAAKLAGDSSSKSQHRPEIDKAVALAEQAIAAAPQRDEAYEVLTLIYSPNGVLADAQLFRQTMQRLRQANSASGLYARLAAQEALAQKRYEQALERFVNLCDADPTDQTSLALAVTAWQQAGKIDSAELWLNDRLALRPGDPVLLEQWVRVKVIQNQADAAIARLQKSIEADSNDLVAKTLLEGAYRATGQIASANQLGEQRLLARPQGVRRELELAALFTGADHAQEAFQCLEWIKDHVSEASMDDLAGAIAIAGRLRGDDQGRESLTIDLVSQTVEQFPDSPLQVYGSGLRALARMDRLDRNFDELADRAVANAPGAAQTNDADVWRDLAQALVDDDQPAAAARALRARLRSAIPLEGAALNLMTRITLLADAATEVANPTPQFHHAELSMQLLGSLGEKGVLSAAMGAEQPMTLAFALYQASIYYARLGADDAAEHLLRQAIALDPANPMAMNNLGYMRIEAGHHDKQTIEWIEQAHTMTPQVPSILDTVGWLRYKQGRFADQPAPDQGGKNQSGALTLIEQALSRDPQPSAEVFDHLGDVHWRLGHLEQASSAWRQALALTNVEDFEQRMMRGLQLHQERTWQLVVIDPQKLYDREYGDIIKRIRAKLDAVEQGKPPAVAPTFAELDK